jgi:hypothetical protein
MRIYLELPVMEQAIRLLCREMGVDDTIRFIAQLDTPAGDFTRDRHALLGDPSVEELFAEARRREPLRDADGKMESDGPGMKITERGMRLLHNELGVADTLRFLRQFRSGAGNYPEDREDIPIEEIFAEARRRQNRKVDGDEHTH